MNSLVLPDIYTASYYFVDLAERVKQRLPNVNIIDIPVTKCGVLPEDGLAQIKEHAEVLFCDTGLIKYALEGCKKLKWVQAKGAGVNSVINLIDKNKPPKFKLTRVAVNGKYIAEYVIMYILAFESNMFDMIKAQTNRQWKQRELARPKVTCSLSICILGVGAVGTEVARMCRKFGMTVFGIGRTPRGPDCLPDHFNHYSTVDQLPDVLPLCDYICNTLPSTPETKDLLTGHLLEACKPKKPIFINVGRGDLIDEATLVRAVKEGWVHGAVLDVTPVEPLPQDSPLWSLPNVIITPHLSGYNLSEENITLYAERFATNYRLFCEGKPLQYEVDFMKGY